MSAISTHTISSGLVSDNEAGIVTGIVDKREIDPLLPKARQVLIHYDRAMGLNTAVLDKSCQVIKAMDYEKIRQGASFDAAHSDTDSRCCGFCKQYFNNPSQIWQGKTYPCENIHLAALTKSRQAGKSHVYSCIVGFAFWTSPVYRSGRYAGALVSGQPLLCRRKEAAEKFLLHCKDRIAAEKFKTVLEDVEEKNSDEIQAMASLLDTCAKEISEKRDDLQKTIHNISGRGGEGKSLKVTVLENQIEKERALLAAFQRGDNETGCKIIYELLDGISGGDPLNLEMKRIRAMELVVLLSRAGTNPETSFSGEISKANYKIFKRIQESKTNEELKQNLYIAAEKMAAEIFSLRGKRHASALRKAQRYIWKNLARKINLNEISKVAGLSAPYFSTVFKDEMGENFSNYINRLRVEKAASLLTETRNPIKTIAKNCGFEDQSWFSKIFKNITGITPGRYRETGYFAGISNAQ